MDALIKIHEIVRKLHVIVSVKITCNFQTVSGVFICAQHISQILLIEVCCYTRVYGHVQILEFQKESMQPL